MPRVFGDVSRVTGEPETVTRAVVFAPDVRGSGDGLVTTSRAAVDVVDGRVDMVLEPGPAVLVLMHGGVSVESIPLLVGEDDVSLARAAELHGVQATDLRALGSLVDRAEAAIGEIQGVKDAAGRVEQAASQAEDMAEAARVDAARVELIASSTRWDGDRLTVNGKTSPPLTGPMGSVFSTWLGETQNLDDLTTFGFYHQSSNTRATPANHYPVAQPGALFVHSTDGSYVAQTYVTFSNPMRVFVRVRNSVRLWLPWMEVSLIPVSG